jgi:hypothetical protein
MIRSCGLHGADLRDKRRRGVLAVKVTSMRMPQALTAAVSAPQGTVTQSENYRPRVRHAHGKVAIADHRSGAAPPNNSGQAILFKKRDPNIPNVHENLAALHHFRMILQPREVIGRKDFKTR